MISSKLINTHIRWQPYDKQLMIYHICISPRIVNRAERGKVPDVDSHILCCKKNVRLSALQSHILCYAYKIFVYTVAYAIAYAIFLKCHKMKYFINIYLFLFPIGKKSFAYFKDFK